MSTEHTPTPFIIAKEKYARSKENTPSGGATHEQLEFLGRLAGFRGDNFKFSTEELDRIEELETAITKGKAVLVGGVAVASIALGETTEQVQARLRNTATYRAALLGNWAEVGDWATIGRGAMVGRGAEVGREAEVGAGVIVPPRTVIPPNAIVVRRGRSVIEL